MPELEARIGRVGEDLRHAVGSLLEAVMGAQPRPADLSRRLGINKDLSSKILKALSKPDPIAALRLMPGPEGLRGLLDAASEQTPDPELLSPVEEAIDAFDRLIRDVAGSRARLEPIICGCLPEAREQFEQRNRHAVYSGISNLKGVTAETSLQVAVIGPATEPAQCDVCTVFGLVGLRRLMIGAPINLSTAAKGTSADRPASRTLEGVPVTEDPAGIFLEEFCSASMPEVAVNVMPPEVHYRLCGNEVGLTSALDVFMCEYVPRLMDLRAAERLRRKRGMCADVEIPVKSLVFDAYIHQDIWPEVEPELLIYDTAMRGPASPNNPACSLARLPFQDSLRSLGRGLSRFRVEEIPRYVEMMRDVFARRGWNPDEFRCYRCHTRYPLYGSQYHAVFETGGDR